MTKCLVDANIFIGAYLIDDSQHDRAEKILNDLEKSRLLSNQLLASEVSSVLLLRSKDLAFTREVTDYLFFSSSPAINITAINGQLWQKTYEVFTKQQGCDLSLPDCSLIAQARLERVKHIVTFDQDLITEFKDEFEFMGQ